jgi:hypothetical protein
LYISPTRRPGGRKNMPTALTRLSTLSPIVHVLSESDLGKHEAFALRLRPRRKLDRRAIIVSAALLTDTPTGRLAPRQRTQRVSMIHLPSPERLKLQLSFVRSRTLPLVDSILTTIVSSLAGRCIRTPFGAHQTALLLSHLSCHFLTSAARHISRLK